jgi:flavodoxin/NAD-dependent dihydropyrimidine dehydrogenase PreA subunit
MKILISYFSATGNTEKMAKAIGKRLAELGARVEFKDATPLDARQEPMDMKQYDAAVFGSPIHSMRSPRLFREWLATLDGLGKPCAMFFTFGGFQIHPTHFDTCNRLQERGFKVVASADFPGVHTFNLCGWQSMQGRPDQEDMDLAAQYAEAIYPRLSGQDPSVVCELDPGPYTEEQLDQFESPPFKTAAILPTRGGQECQLCMLCEEQCPSGAMDAEKGEVDKDKCILCLQCVQNCPDEALEVGDMSKVFAWKMDNDKETPESLRQKRGKLYL